LTALKGSYSSLFAAIEVSTVGRYQVKYRLLIISAGLRF
jgi:hypothetical protein